MASRSISGDPRVALPRPGEESVLPVVALPRSGPGWPVIAVAIVIAALLLFAILESRRRAAQAPDTAVAESLAARPAPPPLVLPPELPPVPVYEIAPTTPLPPPPAPAPAPRIVYVPQPAPVPQAPQLVVPQAPPRTSTDPTLVVDTTTGAAVAAPAPAQGEGAAAGPAAAGDAASALPGASQQTGRVRTGVLANRATTVPQGTLIQAVLETAFDSTRPGYARAIVSRDVRGFDGSRILIPRGSRLIGEYRSEVAPGQRRALINWFRLIRPDGVTIAIGSPAADPLGRGGVRANVNTHFFERFAGAILQSALDIGVNLASQAGNGTVIIGVPGSFQNTTSQILQPAPIMPTLTVPQGRSVSIFVARDLDFTGTENRR
jgi:type IV secretion system protein VirB10